MVLINQGRIILDEGFFNDDFIPDKLVNRDSLTRIIKNCLALVREGRKPTHLWLYGRSGTGKTTVARSVLNQMEKEAGIRSVIINCWEKKSLYDILDHIVTELKIFCAEEHRTSIKLDRLQRHLGKRPLLVLLDEIDRIPSQERSRTLYTLNGIGNIGLISVSNTLEAFFDTEERVRSRITPKILAFALYSNNEIEEILQKRIHSGLFPDTCQDACLKQIAKACSGDARVAIKILRNAARYAEQQGHVKIHPADIMHSNHNSRGLKIKQNLAKLNEDHRILYYLISKEKAILSTRLWNAYMNVCNRTQRKPVAERTFSEYISQLNRFGLITFERARIRGNVRLLKTAK